MSNGFVCFLLALLLQDAGQHINYVANWSFGQIVSTAVQCLTFLAMVAGWIGLYVRQNEKQDLHTTVLAEHGDHLDKLAEGFHALTVSMSTMGATVNTKIDHMEKRIDGHDRRLDQPRP